MCGRRRQDQRCHNMAVHRSRISFSKEIDVCYLTLLIYSAHSHQTQRSSPHSLFMSPCFYSLLSCNSPGKKMLLPPFNPLRSGQRSRASEVHRQLPLPLKRSRRATPDMSTESNKKGLGQLWELRPPIPEPVCDSSHLSASCRGAAFPGTAQGSAPPLAIAVGK